MLKYKERLDELSIDVHNKFNDLIEEYGEFNFALELMDDKTEQGDIIDFLTETDTFYELPTIEMRDGITGDVYDVHVIRITDGEIYCVNMNDTSTSYILKFSDIASIDSKIMLLTEMDNLK